MTGFAPKQFLCPIDFSEHSRLALRWAGSLARVFNGAVTVMHAEAFSTPWEFTPDMVTTIAAALAAARKAVAGQVEQEARRVLPNDVPYQATVIEDTPAEAILAEAADIGADLVVIGSHGRTGLRRLLAGSVVEEVILRLACPVLTVRGEHKSAQLPTPRRILCPVNKTGLARRLLNVAASLARAYDAEVVVMHAVDVDDNERAARDRTDAAQLCAALAADVRRECRLTQVVRQGNAAEQIISAVLEHECDITLVGGRHRPFLDVTVFGATTERVIRHAPTPVLVVPGS